MAENDEKTAVKEETTMENEEKAKDTEIEPVSAEQQQEQQQANGKDDIGNETKEASEQHTQVVVAADDANETEKEEQKQSDEAIVAQGTSSPQSESLMVVMDDEGEAATTTNKDDDQDIVLADDNEAVSAAKPERRSIVGERAAWLAAKPFYNPKTNSSSDVSAAATGEQQKNTSFQSKVEWLKGRASSTTALPLPGNVPAPEKSRRSSYQPSGTHDPPTPVNASDKASSNDQQQEAPTDIKQRIEWLKQFSQKQQDHHAKVASTTPTTTSKNNTLPAKRSAPSSTAAEAVIVEESQNNVVQARIEWLKQVVIKSDTTAFENYDDNDDPSDRIPPLFTSPSLKQAQTDAVVKDRIEWLRTLALQNERNIKQHQQTPTDAQVTSSISMPIKLDDLDLSHPQHKGISTQSFDLFYSKNYNNYQEEGLDQQQKKRQAVVKERIEWLKQLQKQAEEAAQQAEESKLKQRQALLERKRKEKVQQKREALKYAKQLEQEAAAVVLEESKSAGTAEGGEGPSNDYDEVEYNPSADMFLADTDDNCTDDEILLGDETSTHPDESALIVAATLKKERDDSRFKVKKQNSHDENDNDDGVEVEIETAQERIEWLQELIRAEESLNNNTNNNAAEQEQNDKQQPSSMMMTTPARGGGTMPSLDETTPLRDILAPTPFQRHVSGGSGSAGGMMMKDINNASTMVFEDSHDVQARMEFLNAHDGEDIDHHLHNNDEQPSTAETETLAMAVAPMSQHEILGFIADESQIGFEDMEDRSDAADDDLGEFTENYDMTEYNESRNILDQIDDEDNILNQIDSDDIIVDENDEKGDERKPETTMSAMSSSNNKNKEETTQILDDMMRMIKENETSETESNNNDGNNDTKEETTELVKKQKDLKVHVNFESNNAAGNSSNSGGGGSHRSTTPIENVEVSLAMTYSGSMVETVSAAPTVNDDEAVESPRVAETFTAENDNEEEEQSQTTDNGSDNESKYGKIVSIETSPSLNAVETMLTPKSSGSLFSGIQSNSSTVLAAAGEAEESTAAAVESLLNDNQSMAVTVSKSQGDDEMVLEGAVDEKVKMLKTNDSVTSGSKETSTATTAESVENSMMEVNEQQKAVIHPVTTWSSLVKNGSTVKDKSMEKKIAPVQTTTVKEVTSPEKMSDKDTSSLSPSLVEMKNDDTKDEAIEGIKSTYHAVVEQGVAESPELKEQKDIEVSSPVQNDAGRVPASKLALLEVEEEERPNLNQAEFPALSEIVSNNNTIGHSSAIAASESKTHTAEGSDHQSNDLEHVESNVSELSHGSASGRSWAAIAKDAKSVPKRVVTRSTTSNTESKKLETAVQAEQKNPWAADPENDTDIALWTASYEQGSRSSVSSSIGTSGSGIAAPPALKKSGSKAKAKIVRPTSPSSTKDVSVKFASLNEVRTFSKDGGDVLSTSIQESSKKEKRIKQPLTKPIIEKDEKQPSSNKSSDKTHKPSLVVVDATKTSLELGKENLKVPKSSGQETIQKKQTKKSLPSESHVPVKKSSEPKSRSQRLDDARKAKKVSKKQVPDVVTLDSNKGEEPKDSVVVAPDDFSIDASPHSSIKHIASDDVSIEVSVSSRVSFGSHRSKGSASARSGTGSKGGGSRGSKNKSKKGHRHHHNNKHSSGKKSPKASSTLSKNIEEDDDDAVIAEFRAANQSSNKKYLLVVGFVFLVAAVVYGYMQVSSGQVAQEIIPSSSSSFGQELESEKMLARDFSDVERTDAVNTDMNVKASLENAEPIETEVVNPAEIVETEMNTENGLDNAAADPIETEVMNPDERDYGSPAELHPMGSVESGRVEL